MNKKHQPFFGGMILCNSTTPGDGGLTNGIGVFSTFLAWSYPTSIRTFHILFTIYDFPYDNIKLHISISKDGESRIETIEKTFPISKKKFKWGQIIDIQFNHSFPSDGFWKICVTLPDHSVFQTIPVYVSTQPWPVFSQNEIEYYEKNPSIPNVARLVVVCANCSTTYIFEESVLPNHTIQEGVLSFPKSGEFLCAKCAHTINLRDFQGQIRHSLKSTVPNRRKAG